jgi:replicative DNA helicase
MPKLLPQPTNVFRTATSLVNEELGRLERVQHALRAGARVAGIPTGFRSLDDLFGGLNAGKLYFLGGMPGGGKTALALNIAINSAKAGYPVIYVTCDEGARRLALKLACIDMEERMDLLTRGGNITNIQTYISTNPQAMKNITIIDNSKVAPKDLTSKLNSLVKNIDLPEGYIHQGLLVVDYLQAMASAQTTGAVEMRLAVERLCIELRNIAIETDSACLCLSALSRGSEGKNYEDPQLSDFRESSAIEYTADGVMGIYPDKNPMKPVASPYHARKLRLLKNRDGDTSKEVSMRLNGATGKLVEG